ncbi:MAG: cysteine synthase A [Nitrospirae bacterium]|nr:MAG: cysteine synthase A [Nitrospirota bacterium]
MRKDILNTIGNTPLVRLRAFEPEGGARIYGKLEGFNPGGSVKDRIALNMIIQAERSGRLMPGGTIIEPTSGNTGIGLALVGAARGYRVILTMSEKMSRERQDTLRAYGAELILTPGDRGMMGAIERAEEIALRNKDYFMPLQFENPANPDAHRKGTAPEIIRQMGGVPDALVAGVGTGGTITGIGEVFRKMRKDCYIVAVEPAGSPVLSGGEPGPHRIPGIGAGFYPGVLNTKIYDEVIPVTDEDAEKRSRELARRTGVFAGVSSGAALHAAIEVAGRLGKGKNVVVILPDRGERYLSTGVFSR